MMRQFRSARRVAMLAASVLAIAACTDDEHGHEAEVDFMRITVGAQEVMVNSTGAVTGGPISIVSGAVTAVSVEFLDADMDDALGAHADDYQVNITTPANVTFARTGPFAGTLTGGTVGTNNLAISLFHIEENHEDFGPFNVSVTVTAPPVVMAAKR
jgi:hypothetical protein